MKFLIKTSKKIGLTAGIFAVTYVVYLACVLVFQQGFAVFPVSTQHPLYLKLSDASIDKPALHDAQYGRFKNNNWFFGDGYLLRLAIAKFPDQKSCLKISDRSLHWSNIKSEHQFLLCLHLVSSQMNFNQFKNWLTEENLIFSITEHGSNLIISVDLYPLNKIEILNKNYNRLMIKSHEYLQLPLRISFFIYFDGYGKSYNVRYEDYINL